MGVPPKKGVPIHLRSRGYKNDFFHFLIKILHFLTTFIDNFIIFHCFLKFLPILCCYADLIFYSPFIFGAEHRNAFYVIVILILVYYMLLRQ